MSNVTPASIVLSLMRYVEDFRLAQMPDAEHINWDAHAQIAELPQKDAIGLAGVGIAEDTPGMFEVAVGVAISTWDDQNLIRLTSLVSAFYESLPVESSVTIYNPTPVHKLIVASPRAILPVGKAETRSVQAMEFRMLSSPHA